MEDNWLYTPVRDAFIQQLNDAIRAGNMVILRELLAPEEEQDGCLALMENEIHYIFRTAADIGCVESCRVIWARLSTRSKQMYTKDAVYSESLYFHPLETALRYGCFEIVRLFIQEFKFNVNQEGCHGSTPLMLAVDNYGSLAATRAQGPPPHVAAEIVVRFLLDHGADPNLNRRQGLRRPVNEEDAAQRQYQRITDHAIVKGDAEILRILLERGAFVGGQTSLNGLLHGTGNSRFNRTSRESRLNILRLLIEHGNVDSDTSAFIQYSFALSIKVTDFNHTSEIFLQAGIDRNKAIYGAIQEGAGPVCRFLVQHAGVDPFVVATAYPHWKKLVDAIIDDTDRDAFVEAVLTQMVQSQERGRPLHRDMIAHALQLYSSQRTGNDALQLYSSQLIGNDDLFLAAQQVMDFYLLGGESQEQTISMVRSYGHVPAQREDENERHAPLPPPSISSSSPFQVASRQPDTSIFEYFLGLWDEQFSSNGGKNSDGDLPIHLVCCEPHVSIQAIKLLVHHQAATVAMVDGEQGLLPVHFAAMWDASLDVIFYLLHHYPNALRHVGNDAVMRPQHPLVSSTEGSPSGLTEETNSDDDDSEHEGQHPPEHSCGPVKKIAKMMH